MKALELTGQRFGKLVVLNRCGSKHGHVAWRCKCDCGKEIITIGSHLKDGTSRSCGCVRFEKFQAFQKSEEKKEITRRLMTKHGMKHTRIYRIWRAMKTRCSNPNSKDYKYYGARGISVCTDWQNSFEKFKDWALAHGYSDVLTIDRINVNGNYEPLNCRWTTMAEQNKNKRRTSHGTKSKTGYAS